MKRVAILLLLLAASCGRRRDAHVDVPFEIRLPVTGLDGVLDDAPLQGASRLESWVEDTNGQRVAGSARTTTLPATSVGLPTLPFGTGFVVRIDALDADVLLSRGRSFPFGVDRRGATPPPSLFLGSLGRFGRRERATLAADARAILPTTSGALLALSNGHVARFDPFATTPVVDLGAIVAPAASAIAIGRLGIAAFDTASKQLVVIAPDGSLAATVTDPSLVRHGENAMLVCDPGRGELLLIGGLDASAPEDPTAVTRVSFAAGLATPTITPLPSLPASRWAGTALFVAANASADDRVVVFGGSSHSASTTNAYLIDSAAGGPVATVDVSAIDLTGATLVSLGGGQVLAAGGSASADVRLLVVGATPSPSITVASPTPPHLAIRRTSPELVVFGTSLALVVGGAGASGFVSAAELVDLRTFPGQTVQTGRLPSLTAPAVTVLDDRSVWVFDRAGIFGYVPPRGG